MSANDSSNTAITQQLRRHLDNGKTQWVQDLCNDLHPVTLADHLNELTIDEIAEVFVLLDRTMQADTFMLINPEHRQTLIDQLSVEVLAETITVMSHDDRVDLVQAMPADRAKAVLKAMSDSERQDVLRLNAYETGTVGAVTTTDYIRLDPSMQVEVAIEDMRTHAAEVDTIYYGYVLDDNKRLLGTVSMKDLIMARPSDTLTDIMKTDIVTAQASGDELDAARKLARYDLIALPVLDDDEAMLGIVAFDDIMDVLEEEASETMYRKAGIGGLTPSDEKDVIYSKKLTQGPISYAIRLRVFFLLITLGGGLLVGGVIDFFEDTLAAVVAAAIFIPVIMDMGGNVGTQSTTIFARGVALGHINIRRFGKQLFREVKVGLIMGVLLGTVGGAVAYAWQGAPNDIPELGIAVGIALAVVIPLATLLGFLLPWILVKLGFDHASGADPFITTIKDFVSLALYFTLINVLIGL